MIEKKVLLTATVQSHIAQFHTPLIQLLKENGYIVHVAAKNNLNEKNGLKISNVDKIYDIDFRRSPLEIFKNFRAYRELKKIIAENSYEIIHCNTPMGGVITRLAASKYRKKGTKVFYTAHGFHFYKGAPFKNWLFYYPMEKILAKKTDKLITIVEEDYKLALSKRFKTSVHRIHGVGVNSQKFYPVSDEIKFQFRKKENVPDSSFLGLSIGELNSNKNHISVIEAVPSILKKIPNFRLFIAGNGPEKDFLQKRINELGLEAKVFLLGYKTNIDEIIKMSDVVIAASIREGLSMNVLESLFCAKPIVASINRGHSELLANNKELLVKHSDSEGFADRIIHIYDNQNKTEEVMKNSFESAKKYSSTSVTRELELIYDFLK